MSCLFPFRGGAVLVKSMNIYELHCRDIAEFLLSVCNSAALYEWGGKNWFSKGAVEPAKVDGGKFG